GERGADVHMYAPHRQARTVRGSTAGQLADLVGRNAELTGWRPDREFAARLWIDARINAQQDIDGRPAAAAELIAGRKVGEAGQSPRRLDDQPPRRPARRRLGRRVAELGIGLADPLENYILVR